MKPVKEYQVQCSDNIASEIEWIIDYDLGILSKNFLPLGPKMAIVRFRKERH